MPDLVPALFNAASSVPAVLPALLAGVAAVDLAYAGVAVLAGGVDTDATGPADRSRPRHLTAGGDRACPAKLGRDRRRSSRWTFGFRSGLERGATWKNRH